MIGTGIWENMGNPGAAQIRGMVEVSGTLYVHKVETADVWDGYSMLTYNESSNSFAGDAMEQSTYGWFQDLEVVEDMIYCTGSFYVSDDFERIAVYDTQLNTYSGLPNGPENAVYSVLFNEGTLFFGGTFQFPYNHVVAYEIEDSIWSSIGTGLNGLVNEFVILNDTLYAAGTFTLPGSGVAKFALSGLSILNNYPKEEILSVFPNPSNGIIKIENYNGEKIFIYDITGQYIQEIKIKSKTIDMSAFSPGMYTLKLLDNNKSYKIAKVTIN